MNPVRIAVVDYGVNNVGSVLNMLRRIGADAVTARRPNDLNGVHGMVLPGIGAFDAGVTSLTQAGLFDALREAVLERSIPIFGICLGMQLLGRRSEEGKRDGLALVPATTRRIRVDADRTLKIPHMGWNDTTCVDRELFKGLIAPRFYYVHSFHVVCDDAADVAARCFYGAELTAAVRRGHVMGTQFHPEKSHRFGMRVLENFVGIASGLAQREERAGA